MGRYSIVSGTRYTVVNRNPNFWTHTTERNFYEITWTCGHEHGSIAAAEECRKSVAHLPCAWNARIETVAEDQKYKGRELSDEEICRPTVISDYKKESK